MTDPVKFKCAMCGTEQTAEGQVLKEGRAPAKPKPKPAKKAAPKPVQQRHEQEERDPDQWY